MATSLSTELAAALPCPDVEDWMAFALGKLSPESLGEVHDHLDACSACQRVLAEAAHALATAVTGEGAAREDVEWNTTFRRGALVGGRYEIREFIARGGMGEVYEAFDRELRERVALKTVSSTACDSARAVKRLKGEVQLARRVSHANVCRIYDFGSHSLATTGAQLHFLTMEFVEGETLGQRVRLGGALPEAEARKVARELLAGLGAAHEAGVLHRDFKSDNVMLKVGPDGQSSAVVLDFGLARALDSQDGQSGSHSQVVGTFGYIAPEQLDGRPHTTASDVYAFGVVWFEMLTGELPFASSSPPSATVLRTRERPSPPSRLNPSVPSEIDALVLRCLERAPSDRYQTVGEILSRLDALAESNRSPARRRTALGLTLLACAAGAFLYFFAPSAQRPAASTAPRVTARSVQGPARAPFEQASTNGPPATRSVPMPTALAPAPPPSALTQPASSRQAGSPLDTRTRTPASPRVDAHAAPSVEARPAPLPASTTAESTATSAPSSLPPPGPPPAPQVIPPSPLRSRKPDWENPFSAVETQLLARAQSAT
jgi:serine/threonine protein kinase